LIANQVLLPFENIHQANINRFVEETSHNDTLIENIASMNAIIFARN
jgi:hypothetical protein